MGEFENGFTVGPVLAMGDSLWRIEGEEVEGKFGVFKVTSELS